MGIHSKVIIFANILFISFLLCIYFSLFAYFSFFSHCYNMDVSDISNCSELRRSAKRSPITI